MSIIYTVCCGFGYPGCFVDLLGWDEGAICVVAEFLGEFSVGVDEKGGIGGDGKYIGV